MNRTHSLFLALALTSPLAVSAADLDYTYIEGGYSQIDPDGHGDADGWGLGGSVALGEQFHVFGGYTDTEFDDGNTKIRPYRLGLGWNRGISEHSDLVVRANLLDYSGSAIDVHGWETEVGLRSALTDHFETYAALGYGELDADGTPSDGEFYGRVGAQYKFNPSWGIAANATFGDHAREFFIGPRLSF
jgi:Ax21 family sulfation-dependent quorum factor